MFFYQHSPLVSSVYVIGAGGTGGRLIPLLAQFISTISYLKKIPIYVFDDDVVEEKNLRRQLFIHTDIGVNKAEVMAERYGPAFDVELTHVPYRVPNMADYDDQPVGLRTALSSHKGAYGASAPVVFLCVDSMSARRDILSLLLSRFPADTIIIDAGNEDTFGQVRIFNNALSFPKKDAGTLPVRREGVEGINKHFPSFFPFQIEVPYIPVPLHEYSHDAGTEAERSCADLDQTMAINAQMAVSMFTMFQNLVFGHSITAHTIRYHLSGANTTEWLNASWLEKWLMPSEEEKQVFDTTLEKVFRTKNAITRRGSLGVMNGVIATMTADPVVDSLLKDSVSKITTPQMALRGIYTQLLKEAFWDTSV